jgi:hypothetical protein
VALKDGKGKIIKKSEKLIGSNKAKKLVALMSMSLIP